jgi:hypothetical protein
VLLRRKQERSVVGFEKESQIPGAAFISLKHLVRLFLDINDLLFRSVFDTDPMT